MTTVLSQLSSSLRKWVKWPSCPVRWWVQGVRTKCMETNLNSIFSSIKLNIIIFLQWFDKKAKFFFPEQGLARIKAFFWSLNVKVHSELKCTVNFSSNLNKRFCEGIGPNLRKDTIAAWDSILWLSVWVIYLWAEE